jgi:D-cysteine desulfhydrase
MGVEKVTVVAGGSDMSAAMQQVADDVANEGGKAYVIPGGGSTPLGATGYVACAQEILAQTFDLGINIDHVICASGSAGTHAGLVTGFFGSNSRIPVSGINVSRSTQEQEELVYALVRDTAAYLEIAEDIPERAVRCYDEYVGPGYSLPTAGMAEAVRMLASLEGILMDPVYTGKAMAGLIDQVRKGVFKKCENILFVHTGGSPALHVYMEEILGAGDEG